MSNFFYKLGDMWSGFTNRNNYNRLFRNHGIRFLGKNDPVYLEVDIKTLYDIYMTNNHINQVIRKKGNMFANAVLRIVDDEGVDVESKEMDQLRRLLEHPNLFQSQNAWLREYLEQKEVYGNQFIYKSQPTKLALPTSLNNLSAAFVTPITTGKYLDQTEMKGIVKHYEFKISERDKEILKVEDVLWSRVSDLNNPLFGTSPIKSLTYPVSNTKAAYDYLNVISTKKGAIGILSNQGKDSIGPMPLTAEERKRLEDQYQHDYGTGSHQSPVIVTENDIRWTPMSYPTKDLMLMEQIDANFLTVVDHFGLNINIFSSKSQTFENVKNALKQCYQDSIFVEADQFTQSLTRFLNLPEGTRIIADYSHIEILKSDRQSGITSLNSMITALKQLVELNIMPADQMKSVIENQFGDELGLIQ